MSILAMTWVWGLEALDTSQAMVLLALADAANDDGFACWPSQETLARKSRMSVRSVKRHIATLRDAGLIDVETRSSTRGRRANLYRLHVGAEADLSAVSRQRAKLAPSNSTGEEKVDIPPKGQNDPLRNEGSNEAPKGPPMTPTKGTLVAPCNIRTVIKNHQTRPDQNLSECARESVVGVSDASGSGSVGSGPVGDAGSWGSVPAASLSADAAGVAGEADSALVSACLPPALQVLDAQGAVLVTRVLRECLEAGWQPDQIRALMDQPLPSKVGRMSNLVAYRLRVNVLEGDAPKRVQFEGVRARRERELEAQRERVRRSEALAAPAASESVDPLLERAWSEVCAEFPDVSRVEQMHLVWARREALLGGAGA